MLCALELCVSCVIARAYGAVASKALLRLNCSRPPAARPALLWPTYIMCLFMAHAYNSAVLRCDCKSKKPAAMATVLSIVPLLEELQRPSNSQNLPCSRRPIPIFPDVSVPLFVASGGGSPKGVQHAPPHLRCSRHSIVNLAIRHIPCACICDFTHFCLHFTIGKIANYYSTSCAASTECSMVGGHMADIEMKVNQVTILRKVHPFTKRGIRGMV